MNFQFIKKISYFILTFSIFSGIFMNSALAHEKVSVKPVEPFYSEIIPATEVLYAPKTVYLSPLKEAPIDFSSVGAKWNQIMPDTTEIIVEIRLKTKKGISGWYKLHTDIDHKEESHQHQHHSEEMIEATSIISSALSTHYQYRITLTTQDQTKTPIIEDLEFTFINGGTPKQKTDLMQTAFNSPVKTKTVFEEHQDIPDEIDSDAILGKPDTQKVRNPNLVAVAESPVVFPPELRQRVINNRKPASNPKLGVSPGTDLNTDLSIIRRKAWGADESLRIKDPNDKSEPVLVSFEAGYYEKYANELKVSKKISTDQNGNELTWPLSYPESIEKIVIHHTATTKHLDDPARAIRDIYYWHTKSKGWGDIGYNYIIDTNGNIYEGRYGGEMVVGAHAGRGNHGSIGIAVLGNYQESEPPKVVLDAIQKIVDEKTQQYGIDPLGATPFRGEKYPNIMGHREIGSTSCPGEYLFQKLPDIRTKAAANFKNVAVKRVNKDYNFELSKTLNIDSFKQREVKTLNLALKNSGKMEWGPETYFRINPNSNSKSFLINSENIQSSKVGKTVKPGQSVEVEIKLQASKVSGSGLIELFPVINGTKKIQTYLNLPITIDKPAPKKQYDYELESIIYSKSDFKKGDTVEATIKIRNKGLATWVKTGSQRVTLGADKPRDHKNQLLVEPSTRLDNEMEENFVKYNQIATFKTKLKIPSKDGVYREYFTPVIESVTWLDNRDSYLEIKIGNSDQLITSGVKEASTVQTIKSNGNIADEILDLNEKPGLIRIDLAYRGNPIISATGNFALYEGARKIADFKADQTAEVTYSNGIFTIKSGNQTYKQSAAPKFKPMAGTIMRIDNWERRNTWGDRANNNEFRGSLQVLVYDNELHVVNELPLEDYLRGIAEVGSDAPYEKIKTMMIIARTYARFYMDVAEKFPGAPFHLNDDPNYSQKYLGYSFEKRSPLTAKAAGETAGTYVTYDGRLIKTPYFSRSNGRTISAYDKWGWTDAPFLQSVDDSLCDSTEFWGHGVGLSGCGSDAMARAGKTYQEIIKYYYRGADITKIKY
ncbi:hypothetical protein GF376_01035 [Candidatus Peregrinibacteria bacterium]|nr:hypothetical protein [Candidatus Peregrinibacteria bacterium]